MSTPVERCRADFGLSPDTARPIVCVQGLGYVGAAMAVAVASARDADGAPAFDVIGVDRAGEHGSTRVSALAAGRFPFASADARLLAAARDAHAAGNLVATTDARAYRLASVVVVDVHLDVVERDGRVQADTRALRAAIETLASNVPPGALVVVETTVPPGTCDHVVAPALREGCARRGLAADAIRLAHSYERVMPGPDYLDSIVNFWRVYAGADEPSARACEAFLARVVNTRDYPLRRLRSMAASETAKVLENSYRAANIAFIDEWGRLAEVLGIDLFEVLEAVRDRPTHDNIRQPGFGVGGYCLTKDPLFPIAASDAYLPADGLSFPFSKLSVQVNRRMPIANLDRVQHLLGGRLDGRTILLLGIAYRSEVDDTRFSPAEIFHREATARGARVVCHDPLVTYWAELDLAVPATLPDPASAHAVVLAVPHRRYREMDVAAWLGAARPLVYDCDNVLDARSRARLRGIGCRVESTGRGCGL